MIMETDRIEYEMEAGSTYMDWSNPSLREWLTRDSAAAQNAAWRFVAFHQPGFHSSVQHASECKTGVRNAQRSKL